MYNYLFVRGDAEKPTVEACLRSQARWGFSVEAAKILTFHSESRMRFGQVGETIFGIWMECRRPPREVKVQLIEQKTGVTQFINTTWPPGKTLADCEWNRRAFGW